jgi:hypothetical protein
MGERKGYYLVIKDFDKLRRTGRRYLFESPLKDSFHRFQRHNHPLETR